MAKKTQSSEAWKNLVAGGTAGAIEATIMYPTEFVKTQLQLQRKAAAVGGAAAKAPQYSGVVDCAVKTVQTKGPLGLYRGLSTLVIGSIPKAAVRFAAFQEFSKILKDKETGKLSTAGTLLSGMGAGICEAIIAVTPMETVKTKMIADQNSAKPQYKGLLHGVRTMVANEGIGAVYRGLVPTMCKQGTNQAVRFSVFGKIKLHLFQGGDPQKDIGMFKSFAAGSVAGFISVYATMPFDVVKTQMQGLEASRYKNALDCFSTILKNDGVLALWKGTTPRLGRVCFSGGIIFAFYEAIMKNILLPNFPDPE